MPLTKEFLNQLREMEAKATRATWNIYDVKEERFCEGKAEFASIGCQVSGLKGNSQIPEDFLKEGFSLAAGENRRLLKIDADLIVTLRNNIIPLLDEIERLQGENERLKKEIDFAYKHL